MNEITVTRTHTTEERVEMKPDEVEALCKLYGLIWTEARYDPDTEDTRKFAERCLPHIMLLNERWKFRR